MQKFLSSTFSFTYVLCPVVLTSQYVCKIPNKHLCDHSVKASEQNFFPRALMWLAMTKKSTRIQGVPIVRSFKVFRYSFSEALPIFFNRLKSGFLLVRSTKHFHR